MLVFLMVLGSGCSTTGLQQNRDIPIPHTGVDKSTNMDNYVNGKSLKFSPMPHISDGTVFSAFAIIALLVVATVATVHQATK